MTIYIIFYIIIAGDGLKNVKIAQKDDEKWLFLNKKYKRKQVKLRKFVTGK